jgi:hypothetical protein
LRAAAIIRIAGKFSFGNFPSLGWIHACAIGRTTSRRSPMPNEKRPLYEYTKENWDRPGSTTYKVKDGDTWESVARFFTMNVSTLIRHNFMTETPEEVNWYLKRLVGCKKISPSGHNWAFSSDADPGLIFIPTQRIDMEPEKVTGRKTISPIALEFEGPSSPFSSLGKFFDGFTLVDMGFTIFGIALGETLFLGVGIVTAPLAPFVLLGGLEEAPLNVLRQDQMRRGLSLGIVLTADGRSPTWIQSHGFVQKFPIHNINYPEYGKQFQGIYNSALVAGIAHGRQFNTVASLNLFKFINEQMSPGDRAEYYGDPPMSGKEWLAWSSTWSDRKWDNYYRLCAAKVGQKINFN